MTKFIIQKGVLPKGINLATFKETRGNDSAPFTGGGDLVLTSELSKESFVILANSELPLDGSCSPRFLDDYRFGYRRKNSYVPKR